MASQTANGFAIGGMQPKLLDIGIHLSLLNSSGGPV